MVSAFRDNVEELMTGAAFCQDCIVQSLTGVLEAVPPQHSANAEHKLRKSILEVINRIPHTEELKEHVSNLSRALLRVATEDNQENAIVAGKVILDLLRAFRPNLDDVARPLLTLFTQVESILGGKSDGKCFSCTEDGRRCIGITLWRCGDGWNWRKAC